MSLWSEFLFEFLMMLMPVKLTFSAHSTLLSLLCHSLFVCVCVASHRATLGSCTVWSWLCRRCFLCCSIPAFPWWKELWTETLYMWAQLQIQPSLCNLVLPFSAILTLMCPLSCLPVPAGEHWSDAAQPARLHQSLICLLALSETRHAANQRRQTAAVTRTVWCFMILLDYSCSCGCIYMYPCYICHIVLLWSLPNSVFWL